MASRLRSEEPCSGIAPACSLSYLHGVSTLQEIKSAIAQLDSQDRALLAAELFASEAEPDAGALELALRRGVEDVEAGRVQPLENAKALLPGWIIKS
jgi:predicted transcriptional regulator